MDRKPRGNPAVTNYSPVILGGDYGAYSLARAFHERYGVRSTVVSKMGAGAVGHSRIIDSVVMGAAFRDEEALLEKLLAIGVQSETAKTPRLLTGSADWLVRFIVRHRAALSAAGFVIPYADLEIMEIGRASCRASGSSSGVAVSLTYEWGGTVR